MKENKHFLAIFFWSIVMVMAFGLLAKGIHSDRFDLLRDPYHVPQMALPAFHYYLVIGVVVSILIGCVFIFLPRRKFSRVILATLLQDVLIVISLCLLILWTWTALSLDGGFVTMADTLFYGMLIVIFFIAISLHKMTTGVYDFSDNKRYILSVLTASYGVVLLLSRMDLSWRLEIFVAVIVFFTLLGTLIMLLKRHV